MENQTKEGISLKKAWIEEKLHHLATSVNDNQEESTFYYNGRLFAYLDKQNHVVKLKCIEVMIPVLTCQFEASMKESKPGFIEIDTKHPLPQVMLEDLIEQAHALAAL